MKLEEVRLKNIRQFVGEQHIQFSTHPDRKITLIHGPNTAGKTTLLNALYWCFYGKFLPGFDEPTRLKSEQASDDEYYVEIRFEHSGVRYRAKRVGDGLLKEAKLTVIEIAAGGHAKTHPQPDLLIGHILPHALASSFFFAGEMMPKETTVGSLQQAPAEGVRAVLGLKLAELGIEDLKDIRKRKNKELQTLSAGSALADIAAKLQDAEQFVENRKKQLADQYLLAQQMEAQRREISNKIRGLESSAALQLRKEKVQARLQTARNNLQSAAAGRQGLISEYGASLFLESASVAAKSLIDDAVTKKRIPSPFDKAFVQDILSTQQCICHRPVHPGTDEYRAVVALVNSATDETSFRRALSIRGVCGKIFSDTEAAPTAFRKSLELFENARSSVEDLEQDESRINETLKHHESQTVREHELQVENIEIRLRDMVADRRIIEREIDEKEKIIAGLKIDMERANAISPQVERVKSSIALLEAMIRRLEAELNEVEKRGIDRISAVLNKIVANSTRRKYSALVASDYGIKLFRDESALSSNPVSVLSSGERRLINLCFVAALVTVCRERASDASAILLPGAVAPLLIDAAFGELDPEYQALAASTMMDLSEQLILMLSKTHWTREVDKAIRPFMGSEYLLVSHHTGPARDAAPVQIQIEQQIHQQMVYDSAIDKTEVQRVGDFQ